MFDAMASFYQDDLTAGSDLYLLHLRPHVTSSFHADSDLANPCCKITQRVAEIDSTYVQFKAFIMSLAVRCSRHNLLSCLV